MDDWEKAGKIASETLQYGKTLIKKGASVLAILDACEKKIDELGGKPAFPAQISLNDTAAHFCPVEDVILGEDLFAATGNESDTSSSAS